MFEHTIVRLPSHVYRALERALRAKRDTRTPEQIVEHAVKAWIATATAGPPSVRGYQWKSLFLPEGTRLRMHYKNRFAYAEVCGDAIVHEGVAMSPRQFTNHVAGCVRNAWRELWIRCPGDGSWHLADTRRRILRRELEPLPPMPAPLTALAALAEYGPQAPNDQGELSEQARRDRARAYKLAIKARRTRHCLRRGDIVRDDQPDLARMPDRVQPIGALRVGRWAPHDRRQLPYFPPLWLGGTRQGVSETFF
jgi:hypothetical protein